MGTNFSDDLYMSGKHNHEGSPENIKAEFHTLWDSTGLSHLIILSIQYEKFTFPMPRMVFRSNIGKND